MPADHRTNQRTRGCGADVLSYSPLVPVCRNGSPPTPTHETNHLSGLRCSRRSRIWRARSHVLGHYRSSLFTASGGCSDVGCWGRVAIRRVTRGTGNRAGRSTAGRLARRRDRRRHSRRDLVYLLVAGRPVRWRTHAQRFGSTRVRPGCRGGLVGWHSGRSRSAEEDHRLRISRSRPRGRLVRNQLSRRVADRWASARCGTTRLDVCHRRGHARR